MKEDTRSDRKELELLRISLARIAQMLGVQTILLPVLARADISNITTMARTRGRGWNSLAGAIVGRIEQNAYSEQSAISAALDAVIGHLQNNDTHTAGAILGAVAGFFTSNLETHGAYILALEQIEREYKHGECGLALDLVAALKKRLDAGRV